MTYKQYLKKQVAGQKRYQKEMKHKAKMAAIQKVRLPEPIPVPERKMGFWRKLMLTLRLLTE